MMRLTLTGYTRLEVLRALLGLAPNRPHGVRRYDEKQAEARMVTWLCCKRTVWSTNPERGCLQCKP